MLHSVSVIIPTFNAEKTIEKCIRSVLNQNYSPELVEIIIADNCSEDGTVNIAKQLHANIKTTRECTYLSSPYSARNRGIEKSKGDVIVLLDSDCKPEKEWLTNGVKAMHTFSADIIGGEVLFSFGDKPTLAEMYDSIMNIKMKESIEKSGIAKTANLFIKREVFTDTGLFPEGWRSGGDVYWTGKATSAGKIIAFCKDATVYKPARKFPGLLKKQWRVAKAQSRNWIMNGNYKTLLFNIIKLAIPPTTIKRNISECGHTFIGKHIIRLFLLSLVIRPVMITGNLLGIFFWILKIKE